jgi:hypothetical protein
VSGILLDSQDSTTEEKERYILFFLAQDAQPFCQSSSEALTVSLINMGKGLV